LLKSAEAIAARYDRLVEEEVLAFACAA